VHVALFPKLILAPGYLILHVSDLLDYCNFWDSFFKSLPPINPVAPVIEIFINTVLKYHIL